MVNAITDMMSIKDEGKARKSVLLVQSGQERIIGQHVTEKEKQWFYKRMKYNAEKHPKEPEPEKPPMSDEEKEDMMNQIKSNP